MQIIYWQSVSRCGLIEGQGRRLKHLSTRRGMKRDREREREFYTEERESMQLGFLEAIMEKGWRHLQGGGGGGFQELSLSTLKETKKIILSFFTEETWKIDQRCIFNFPMNQEKKTKKFQVISHTHSRPWKNKINM